MKPFNLDEYLKNPSRKVVTRDGRAVKIHCTNHIIDAYSGAVIAKIEGDTYSNSFREDGRYDDYEETNNDFFFAPEKHEGWINLLKDLNGDNFVGSPIIYETKEKAEKDGKESNNYISTAKIEWEE